MNMTLTTDQNGIITSISGGQPCAKIGQHLSRIFEVSTNYNKSDQALWFNILCNRNGQETAVTLVGQQQPSGLILEQQPDDQYLITIKSLPDMTNEGLSDAANFSGLFETSDSCFYFRALNGQLRTVLGSMEQRPQVPDPLQAGQSIFDFYSPKGLKKLLDADQQMTLTGQPIETDDTINDTTGHRIFHSAKSPLYDNNGKLLGISGLTHEITEYQHSIEELHSVQDRATRSMMSSSMAMIVLRLSNKQILSVNDSFISHFGYQREALIGATPVQMCMVDLSDQTDLEQKINQNREIAGHRLVIRTKANVAVNVEINAFVMNIDNEPCLVCLLLDESRAETAENRLQLIAEASFEGIALHKDGIVIEVNQTGCEILGRTRDQLIGRNILDLVPLEDKRAVHKTWTHDLHGAYEIHIIRPDNSERTIVVRSHEVIEADQHHRIVAFHDVTTERELKNQLLRTQKMEILGQLTGGIAHDFNNILASILGFSELLMERLASDEPIDQPRLLHWATQVNKSGSRGRDLVKQMLSFSRGGSARPVPTQLNGPINEVLAMVRGSIPLSITADTHVESVPSVIIDPIQLNQVLLNLCLNASHAIGDNEGSISVSTSLQSISDQRCSSCQKTFSGDYVAVAINDTGNGIKPEHLEKVFEPFFSTKSVNQGSGMGLAVIHGIVHDCHGHIVVESELGKGSTFTLLLPPSTTAADEKPTKKVVLVDDDELVADMVYRVLMDQGYQVQSFNCPLAALAEFEVNGEQWDLLITDYRMPNLTGVELIQKIHEKRKNLPVILHTGYLDEAKSQEPSPDWVTLEKPVEQRRLLSAISELLTKNSTAPIC